MKNILISILLIFIIKFDGYSNKKSTSLAGEEGAAEDALGHYGSIYCEQILRPLTINEIRNEIENGRPFIIGTKEAHAIVCYGINSDNSINIMNPNFGGYTQNYSYNIYQEKCRENLVINCINQIDISGDKSNSEKHYYYEAAQSVKIHPNTKINTAFHTNVTNSYACQQLCVVPTCQIIYDSSDSKIKLHIRNGHSFSYELIRYDGVLIKKGSGILTSNDQEITLCSAAQSIYIMRTITITSGCGTSRTLKGYKIPIY